MILPDEAHKITVWHDLAFLSIDLKWLHLAIVTE
jgi:hypothetical protein